MRYPEKLLSALRAIDKALPNEYTPMYILLLGYHVWCDLLDQKDLDIPNLSQTTNILPVNLIISNYSSTELLPDLMGS